jgi:hypothetical protein
LSPLTPVSATVTKALVAALAFTGVSATLVASGVGCALPLRFPWSGSSSADRTVQVPLRLTRIPHLFDACIPAFDCYGDKKCSCCEHTKRESRCSYNLEKIAMSTKITEALVAALVLAGVSTAMVSNASAAAFGRGWYQSQDAYMGPRHDPTNTNGF